MDSPRLHQLSNKPQQNWFIPLGTTMPQTRYIIILCRTPLFLRKLKHFPQRKIYVCNKFH